MPITSPSQLNSLVERTLLVGMTTDELKKAVVLKPGKTFDDFYRVFTAPAKGESRLGFDFAQVVGHLATRLFNADVVEESLVPDDGF